MNVCNEEQAWATRSMLTISLVNDILARLQQEHKTMQSNGKKHGQHRQWMYVTKNKHELLAQ